MPETQHDSADTLGFEEITDRLSPDDPQISPDRRHVAFTVAAGGRKSDHPDRAIWLSRDRQPATRFTGGEANNHDPRWSPDGTQLLFIANRKDVEKEMLYLLPVAGGEAQRLGDLDGSLTVPSWSPDGSKIAVLRTDPETEAEKKRKTEDKEDAYLYEEDAKRSRLWVVDAVSGDARQLTFGDQSVWDYAWSPDGDRIVVVTTGLPVINEFILKGSLWQVPVAGGLMTHVADFPGGPGSPVVREVDGKLVVAVTANRRRDDPAESLWIVPLDGSAQTNLTPDYAGSFSQLIADPADRAGLFARVVEGTRQRLYRISAGGDLQPVTPANLADRGTISAGPTIAADGRALACIWQASDTPPEVFIADIGQDAVAVSELGKPFAGRLYGGEVVHWESTDGVTIEGILIKPADHTEGERVPMIVEIHGGPSWQWEDRLMMSWHDWAQMLAVRGYAVLLPNPRGSTGYGAAFEKLLQDDIGGGEAQDVISGARAMVERGIADPERLGIGGWSWGGYLTAWSITQTNIFKAAVMGAGVANLISDHAAGDIPAANLSYYSDDPYTDWELYARASPIRFARNVTTPTLIVHGDADIRVHPTQGQEYYRALKTVGVPTRFVRYPREGHGFQERAHQIDLMRQIVEWFERYIPA